MSESKAFAVFDIDGTLIRWQLYHAIADELAKQGKIEPKLFDAIKAARMVWKKRSAPEAFKMYERQLVKIYEQVLVSLSVIDFERAAQAVFNEYQDQIYTYTRDLIKKLKADGYLLLAISGSQQEIVAKIAEHYGFDDCVGTEYIQEDGAFTGKSIFYAADKRKVLEDLIKKHGLGLKGSIAVGDSTTDIPMLEMVEQPIAFNPERKLFDAAVKNNWKIIVERKNMVYELEGEDGKYHLVTSNP